MSQRNCAHDESNYYGSLFVSVIGVRNNPLSRKDHNIMSKNKWTAVKKFTYNSLLTCTMYLLVRTITLLRYDLPDENVIMMKHWLVVVIFVEGDTGVDS